MDMRLNDDERAKGTAGKPVAASMRARLATALTRSKTAVSNALGGESA